MNGDKIFLISLIQSIIVFLCLVFSIYLCYLTVTKIGSSRRSIVALSFAVLAFLVCKFVDTSFALRLSSGHKDITPCLKSISYGLSHLFLMITCYLATGTWLKFSILLECIARGSEGLYKEKITFLIIGLGSMLSLVIALNIICFYEDCTNPNPTIDLDRFEYTVHLVAYVITTAIFFHTASYLNKSVDKHFPAFKNSAGKQLNRAINWLRTFLLLRVLKDIFIVIFFKQYRAEQERSMNSDTWFYPVIIVLPFALDVVLSCGIFYSVHFYLNESTKGFYI